MADAHLEEIRVKVNAEFWFNPVDHVPLEERRIMLRKGAGKESVGGHDMLRADTILKRVAPRYFLEAFVGELACALKWLSSHGCQSQNANNYCSRYDFMEGMSSNQQSHDHSFSDQISVDIQKDGLVVKFEPVLASSRIIVDSEDKWLLNDCILSDAQPSVYPNSCIAGCNGIARSSTDHLTTVKIKHSDGSMNLTAISELEHTDSVSRHEQYKVPILSSIVDGLSQVDVLPKSDSLGEGRNNTTSEGMTPISTSEPVLQEGLSSHAWSSPEKVSRPLKNGGKEHDTDKLNGKNLNASEFPSKRTFNSSKVDTATGTCGMPPGSSNVLFSHSSVSSFVGVDGQQDMSLGDGTCMPVNTAVPELHKQSSLKANKLLSSSVFPSDPPMLKYRFGDSNSVSDESPAKHVHPSISVNTKCPSPKKVGKDSSDIFLGSFSVSNKNLPKKVVQPCTFSKKNVDYLVRDASLPTSAIMMKLETAANVDILNSESGVLREFNLFHPVPVDVLAEKGKWDSTSRCLDGVFSVSSGVKVEQPEEIHELGPTGENDAMKYGTLTSSMAGDKCKNALCSASNTQLIQGVDTNFTDMPSDSSVSAFSTVVNSEISEHVGGPNAESKVNFNFFSESPDKADIVLTCPALPTFNVRVKDEPVEEDHVVCGSESRTKNCSSCPMFDSPVNFSLNHLSETHVSSDDIDCPQEPFSRVCNKLNDQGRVRGLSRNTSPEDIGTVKGQKVDLMANQPTDSDGSASKDVKTPEKLKERSADIVSEITIGTTHGSYASSNLQLKSETVDGGIQNLCNSLAGNFPSSGVLCEVKNEIATEIPVDRLDHMPLVERIHFLASTMPPELNLPRKSRGFRKSKIHGVDSDTLEPSPVKTVSRNQRKRKRTATDSIEIALEEDAPGLLQGLLDRGINLDEIKLYGCEEDVDLLDISSDEDSFQDLAAVIYKLFSEQPSSLFKFAPSRSAKGTKASYCLACLISLIEQTRYLCFRNHPVEWGWCRDLQSFIFVFEMHNRIVLERPEYGYATYFFELVESFPIDWQVKRLVTSMKLTSYSRATLLENRALLVGVDLSEGEARVLEEYGWRPDTGLGSLLNYCDRVVHDRNERDASEWRQKIGKLLMDGYYGGCIVKADIPKRVMDYVDGHHRPPIKMEMM